MKKHSELVQEHFKNLYKNYDVLIRKLIPKYDEMHRIIVGAVEIESLDALRILDLGIGTGQTTQALLKKFPSATIDGVDFSEKMLARAKERLSGDSERVHLYYQDMEDFNFASTYDACVAVLSIHHIVGKKKKDIFAKVFQSLKDDAVFVIGDIVKFDSKEETKEKETEWQHFLQSNLNDEEAEFWFNNYLEEDRPSSSNEQVEWLKEVGFSKVEVLWEHINHAIVRAKK